MDRGSFDRAEVVPIDTGGDSVLARCHWLPRRRGRLTLLLVHASALDHPIVDRVPQTRGLVLHALDRGWNVIRLGLRPGGPPDLPMVVGHLLQEEHLGHLALCGFSRGAAQVLRLAGEWGGDPPAEVRAAVALSPYIGPDAGVVPHIRLPTLVIHAKDDPFVPLPAAVRGALAHNPATHLLLCERGSHLGFLSPRADPDRLWTEARVLDFLELCISPRPRPQAPETCDAPALCFSDAEERSMISQG